MELKKATPSNPVFGDVNRTDLGEMGPYNNSGKPVPQCKTCRYAMRGKFGYRNARCYKYQKESGKPSSILFNGAKCSYYRKDRLEQKE